MNPILRWMRVLSLAILPPTLLLAADADEPATWSVPVRLLGLPAPAADPLSLDALPADTVAPASSTDALTGGVPPQYRTGLQQRDDDGASPDDPTVRLMVPLAERPVLVEARITIDGQPFRLAREQRIDQLIAELAKPASLEPASAADPPAAAPGDQGRLRRYVQATGRVPGRGELRWLFQRWIAGPTLLVVHEHFQLGRADQSPLFNVLDRDEDGWIGAEELAKAEQTLLRYDRDQDEVMSFEEITVAGKRTPVEPAIGDSPAALITMDELASPPVLRRLTQQYGESFAIPDGAADVQVDVTLDSVDPRRSQLAVSSLSLPDAHVHILAHANVITLRIAGAILEFSAVQTPISGASDQVSVGAVRDGYPLLPIADRNQDGRLSIRELRQVAALIAQADPNQDGRVGATELLPTMRVVFGYGATAHQPLATLRSVYPPATAPLATPPEWFTRMDRNQDDDLTPREFLGGKEPFDALDVDRDGLVSVAEALVDASP